MNNWTRARARLHRIVALWLLALCLPAAHAVPFSGIGATGAPGSSVDIFVNADSVVDLTIFPATFDVSFDPGAVGFFAASMAEPGLLGDGFPLAEDLGYVLLSVFALDSGSGPLVRLTFDIPDSASLGDTVVSFVCDTGCQEFAFDNFTATITIAQDTSQPVPEPGSALLVLAGLLAAGVTRRKERSVR